MQLHPSGRFDNEARHYGHITAVPLAAAMGAEIQNVDLSNLADAQFVTGVVLPVDGGVSAGGN